MAKRIGLGITVVLVVAWSIAFPWQAPAADSGQERANPHLLSAAEPPRGVGVVLGLGPGQSADWVLRRAAQHGWIIYFQSASADEVQQVRQAAEAAGMLGTRVFADRDSTGRIHLTDNLADAVWVPDSAAKVAEAEVLRVLRPEGTGYLGQRRIVKPVPAGVDDWSHPFHGPDNNPQSRDQLARAPYRTQFLAEPLFCPMPEVTVASGGRVFKAFGHIAHKANQNAMLNTLLAINGYNGMILWRRPLREGFMIHRNTMIATPEVLFLADDQSCKLLDAQTGQVRAEIVVPPGAADGPVWKWMALEPGADGRPVLYALVGGVEVRPKTVRSDVPGLGHWPWGMWEGHEYADPKTNFAFGRTFLAIDPQTQKILWRHAEEAYIDGRGVCMKNGRIYYYAPGQFLGCLEGRDGQVLWKCSDPELLTAIGPTGRAQNPTEGYATTSYLKCTDKYVFFAGPQRPNLVVASAKDGKLVWFRRGGNLHLILRDEVFYGVGPNGAKFRYDTWEALVPLPNRRSCTRATASLDSVFYRAAEGTMQIVTTDDHAQHLAPMRPPCQDGVVVANGVLYWGPWMCGCPLSFYGHVALSHAGKPARPVPPEARTEPGEGDAQKVAELTAHPADWTCAGGDPARSMITAAPIPSQVRRAWEWKPRAAARPTSPIVAGGLVFFGDDRGILRAVEVASGKLRWQTYTSGAIFQAPVFWKGRLFVGAGDGRVYAFEAATGRRLWTHRLPPEERWIPVFGKLISTWPVAGGVIVHDGTVYAAAGIAHYDGTYVCALDALTGKPRWYNDTSGRLSERVNNGLSLQGELYLEGDTLCFAGGSVYPVGRFDCKTGRCLVEPVHAIGSQAATAFYVYYPDYGQYVPLDHRLPDGQRLHYQPLYEGSQHTRLALLALPKAARPAKRERGFQLFRPTRPAGDVIWESAALRRFHSFMVGSQSLVAAGQEQIGQHLKPFLAAIRIRDGNDLWYHELSAPAVRRGTAIDHTGRIVVALADGRLECFEPAGR